VTLHGALQVQVHPKSLQTVCLDLPPYAGDVCVWLSRAQCWQLILSLLLAAGGADASRLPAEDASALARLAERL
jgi:hypothetical protein